jgi:predicted dehydrogenase
VKKIEKVKVGIIGAGIISDVRAMGYQTHKNAEIVAVCDLDEKRAQEKARKWGIHKVFTDYKELLGDDSINSVDILLPHSLHSRVVIDAANAGKHVAVIKPIAMSLSEADSMIRAAKANGIILSVGENYVNYPPIVKAAELIRTGEIGEPTNIRMTVASGRGAREGWIEPEDPTDWRHDKKTNGGFVYDAIVHNAASARLLMGSDIESVTAIFQHMDSFDERPGVVSWSHVGRDKFGTLLYGTRRSSIVINTDYYALHEAFEILGTKGILEITRVSAKMLGLAPLTMYRDGNLVQFENLESDYALGFRYSVHDFVEAVMEGKEPKFTAEDGKKEIKFAWAVYKAATERREVRLDEIT